MEPTNNMPIFLANTLQNLPDLVYVYRIEAKTILYINNTSLPWNIENKHPIKDAAIFYANIHPDDVQRVQYHADSLYQNNNNDFCNVEYRIANYEGNYTWVRLREKVYERDENGRPLSIFATCRDINERVQNENKLRAQNVKIEAQNADLLHAKKMLEQQQEELITETQKLQKTTKQLLNVEQRLNLILENNHIGAWDIDLCDNSVIRNLMHAKIFGYKEVLPGWTQEMFIQHVLPEDREHVLKVLKQATENKSSAQFECRIKRADGVKRWVKVSFHHQTDENNNVIHRSGIIQDITEQKQTEKELHDSLELFFSIFYNGPHPFAMAILPDNLYIEVNERFCELVGYTRSQLIGKTALELGIIENVRERNKYIEQISSGQEIKANEFKIVRRDGEVRNIIVSARKVVINDISYSLNNIVDITDQKRAEMLLKESEKMLLESQKAAHIGSWAIDLTSNKISWSDETYRIHGLSDDTFTPTFETFGNLIHPDDLATVSNWIQSLAQGKKQLPLEFKTVPVDGRYKIHLLHGELVRDEITNDSRLVGTIQDITEQRRIENLLKQKNEEIETQNEELRQANEELIKAKEKAEYNEKRLMSSLDNMMEGCQIIGSDWRYIYINDAAERHNRRSKNELLGKVYMDMWPGVESTHIFSLLKDSMEQRTTHHLEYEFIFPDGTNRWFDLSIQPIPEGIFILSVDITDKKMETYSNMLKSLQIEVQNTELQQANKEYEALNEELRQTNEELLKAKEKAEESDTLKSSFLQNMSHEVRTPLNAIVGFSQLMAMPNQSQTKIERFAQMISKSSDKLIGIITDVIEISQIHSNQAQMRISEFNIADMIRNLASIFGKEAAEKNIAFELHLNIPTEKQMIKSDNNKVNKILFHLIDNAVKFTNEGMVSVICNVVDDDIHFYISDTGIGIEDNMKESIFEPFRQVETGVCRNYGGNGIGLSLIKAYIHLLNGALSFESEYNKGSTFHVVIPNNISNTMILPKQQYPHNIKPIKTILIAEDEYSNYTFLMEMIDTTTTQTLYARNGKQAVEMCKQHDDIDLVLMDIKMPVMDGITATKEIKTFRPDLVIIAQTAYALESEKEQYMQHFDDYIVKPIEKDLLQQKLQQYLYS